MLVFFTSTMAAREMVSEAVRHCPYADCFAAALAQTKNAPLVTGDPEFHKVAPGSALKLEWLSQQEG